MASHQEQHGGAQQHNNENDKDMPEIDFDFDEEMGSAPGDAGPKSVAEIAIELIAGAIFTSTTAPFTRLGALMTAQHELVRNGSLSNPYLGLMDCASCLLQKEGWKSLFRGTLFTIAASIPEKIVDNTIVPLVGKALVTIALKAELEFDTNPFLVFGYMMASRCIVHLTASALVQPLQVIKHRYTCDIKSKKNTKEEEEDKDVYEFSSGMDCAAQLVARGGYGSLYPCVPFSVAGMLFPEAAGIVRLIVLQSMDPESPMQIPLSIGFSLGLMALTHPFDVVRQRMFSAVGTKKQYGSAMECVWEIYDKEGFFGFFAGFKTSLLFTVGGTMLRIPLGI